MTRDAIQGFIDGYFANNGDPQKLKEALKVWMTDHPIYPNMEQEQETILNDLDSYRGYHRPV